MSVGIKVGEYIRTRNGSIQKVLEVHPYYENDKNRSEYDYISTEIFKQWKRYQLEKIVAKHSFNIIDLIEEGDYVNGKFVYSVGTAIGGLPIVNNTDGTFTPENMIKSIVTKESFEGSEYKVC